MQKKVWLIMLAMILSACSRNELVLAPRVLAEKIRHDRHIDKIKLEGPFDVDIHTGYRHNQVMMKGDEMGLSYLLIDKKDGVLSIRCPQKCVDRGRIYIRLDLKHLHDFEYRGRGKINAQHIHAPNLNLYIRNASLTRFSGYLGLRKAAFAGGGFVSLKGVKSQALFLTVKGPTKVQIQGEVHLATLHQQNGSWLSIYWLKANRLELRARGTTFMQFAGVVNVLDVELWGHAKFKGRYIRATQTFVKTHDHAMAEINTSGYQHTLANDASDIYYYDVPKAQTDLMGVNGAVLDFEDWTPGRRGNLYTPVKYW